VNTALLLDVVAGACFLVGASLALVAAVGILRFPDVLTRLHSGTKPQVIGLMFMLVGLATQLRDPAALGLLLLVVVFQLVTSPVATHMLARAHYRAGQVRPGDLVVDELTPVLGEDEGPRGAP
jgi:multicomponent Na+:H+ antiporter subunit G